MKLDEKQLHQLKSILFFMIEKNIVYPENDYFVSYQLKKILDVLNLDENDLPEMSGNYQEFSDEVIEFQIWKSNTLKNRNLVEVNQ